MLAMKKFKTTMTAAVLGCLFAVNVSAVTNQDDKKRPKKDDKTVIIQEEKKRPPADEKKGDKEKKPEKKPSAQVSFPFNLFSSIPS